MFGFACFVVLIVMQFVFNVCFCITCFCLGLWYLVFISLLLLVLVRWWVFRLVGCFSFEFDFDLRLFICRGLTTLCLRLGFWVLSDCICVNLIPGLNFVCWLLCVCYN